MAGHLPTKASTYEAHGPGSGFPVSTNETLARLGSSSFPLPVAGCLPTKASTNEAHGPGSGFPVSTYETLPKWDGSLSFVLL